MTTQQNDVRPGLDPSDADYLGSDHAQLQQYLGTNLDVQQVSQVSAAYDGVRQAFEDFAKNLGDAVTKSKGTWEGTAATGAQDYFATLATWAEANSENARIAAQGLDDQGSAAQTAKNAMPEPVPFNWDDEFKAWQSANPFDLSETIDKSMQKQQDSRQAHEDAANVMTQYDQNLYAAGSKQPVFADPPKFGVAVGGSGTPELPSSSGSSGDSSSHGVTPGSPASPAVSMPDPSHLAGAASGGVSGPSNATGAVAVHQGGATTAQGFGGTAPAAAAPGQAGASGMGMSPMPMGGMGGGGGFGGDTEYQSKIGQATGFGPGGGGGMEATPAASGAARPDGPRRGMGGGTRWRDQSAEEEDDGRRFLVDGDSDDVFGDDSITAPPVIGE